MSNFIRLGIPMEDGGTYVADQACYDVHLCDTARTRDDFHLKYMFDYKKEELPIAFWLKDRKNITLDFGGATLKLHGQIQPFLLENCENIRIQNCVIEYDRSAHSEAEILEVTENRIRLRFSDRFPYRVENKGILFMSEHGESSSCPSPEFFQIFDKQSRRGIGIHLGVVGENFRVPEDYPYHYWHFLAEEDNGSVILHGEHPPAWKAGDVISISHEPRWITALTTMHCKNIFLQNFRIINGLGMGIAPFYTENLYIDRLLVTHDERSHGLIANTADVLHAVGCKGELVIENSTFEGMMDDAVNVHTNFLVAESGSGTLLCAKNRGQLPINYARIFHVGDQIATYRGPTMEQTGTYRIKQIQWTDVNCVEITTDTPVQVEMGDLIENLSTQPNLTMQNCIFGKANTHLRLQTRGKVWIENCYFELPIYLSGDASYWFESSPIQDLTVKNCAFRTPKGQIRIKAEFIPTSNAPYYHQNIKVLNSSFESENPITGGYSNGIVFLGNTHTEGKPMRLTLTNCGSCEADNCTVERFSEVKSKMSRG